MLCRIYIALAALLMSSSMVAQEQQLSVAREWVDGLNNAIRQDGFGPTIHARNIHHITMALYDAWAVYDDKASTYLLGKTVGNYACPFDATFSVPDSLNKDSLRNIAMNYAAYRVIESRFNEYGSKHRTMEDVMQRFKRLGGKISNRSADYMSGTPEAMGNYIAERIIEYGFSDGAKEADLYEAYSYEPVNPPLSPHKPGIQELKYKNRWQPLAVKDYVHDKGLDPKLKGWNNLLILNTDVFVTPEWGEVTPFAMTAEDRKTGTRRHYKFNLYMDPGDPPYLDYTVDSISSEQYKWNFLLVLLWSAQLDPADGVEIDISPGVHSYADGLPATYADYPDYFNLMEGDVKMKKRKVNPKTGKPYAPNKVLRGDYTRVIAEYWVDGVNTPGPPGHWMDNLSEVNYHPENERKWGGKGPQLSQLEWDVKTYFAMGGALHDAGIAAWSVKGWYDYVRPITAIRYMGTRGQCTSKDLPLYHPEGLPLIEGYIEQVGKKDPLVGANKEHLHKLKVKAWRGPEYIGDPLTDAAGVGWILVENWWPYQRYSFTTPPFAGYVSGHSTFSSAGAAMMEQLTNDPYFPGGLWEKTFKKNEFLEFEEGPSKDITLQWATYRDAAFETCLSRIWGGIHPPADDIPGRKIGKKIAAKAFDKASKYFKGK